jgi:hypothetical protein
MVSFNDSIAIPDDPHTTHFSISDWNARRRIHSLSCGQTTASRSILPARDFIENPLLLAHARQSVVLDNEPNPLEEAVVRYELEKCAHDFCLSGTRTDLTGMVLKDMFGDKVLRQRDYPARFDGSCGIPGNRRDL